VCKQTEKPVNADQQKGRNCKSSACQNREKCLHQRIALFLMPVKYEYPNSIEWHLAGKGSRLDFRALKKRLFA